MKKTFLLIAAVLMMGSAAFAGGGFDLAIGPKVGYQTAKLSYAKDDIKAGFANSFTAGLFGRVTIGNFYVQPEVMYFQTEKLFSLNVQNVSEGWLPEENVNFTLNSVNLQVPVFLGFKVLDLDVIALRVQAGPTANFTLSSQTLFDKTYTLTPDEGEAITLGENEEQAFDTKTIAWGIQAGVGVDVLKKITLDINYNFGISKLFGENLINKTEWANYIDTSNIATSTQNLFMVTLGFKFL
jgi:hypothetical protein